MQTISARARAGRSRWTNSWFIKMLMTRRPSSPTDKQRFRNPFRRGGSNEPRILPMLPVFTRTFNRMPVSLYTLHIVFIVNSVLLALSIIVSPEYIGVSWRVTKCGDCIRILSFCSLVRNDNSPAYSLNYILSTRVCGLFIEVLIHETDEPKARSWSSAQWCSTALLDIQRIQE